MRIEQRSLDALLSGAIQSEIELVAQEVISEGKLARERAEEESGIVVDNEDLQFQAYIKVRRAWWRRKEELKLLLVMSGVRVEDTAQFRLQQYRKREERKRRRRERKIQRQNRKEMAKQEWEMRKFLMEEKAVIVRETRAMKKAEV